MSLQKPKQVRQGHRLHVDKLIGKVNADTKPKYEDLKALLASLIAKEAVLGKCDDEILDLLTEEKDILEEIENASSWSDKIVKAKTEVICAIEHHEKKNSESTPKVKSEPNESSSSKDSKIQIKLPSIDVGKYDGSLLSWSLFWDKFTVAVDSR